MTPPKVNENPSSSNAFTSAAVPVKKWISAGVGRNRISGIENLYNSENALLQWTISGF